MTKTTTRIGTAVLAGAGLVLGLGQGAVQAPLAHACGGFFCSQAAPVEQSAEEIMFVDNPDDTVTAVIRIMYQGPSEHFAWVLPMPGVPTVSVSSNSVFDNLRNVTDPQYYVNQTVEGECKDQQNFGLGVANGGGVFAPEAAADSSAGGGIDVLAHDEVGPYVYDVIQVDSSLSDPAQVAVDWLDTNGYDVTSVGPEVLRPYLADGLNLIAFKLQKSPDVTAGSIRPVVLTYDAELPSIPIIPTAVAAQDDMGIRVWVLGNEQAIPANYKSLVINEAIIDWFNWQSTYDQVVTTAANEAGGQGFVTEMASSTSALDDAVFGAGQLQQWINYSRQSFVDGFDMIQQASWQFRWMDGWREAVCGAVTLPDGVTCQDFGQTPDAYRDTAQIDETAFMRKLYEGVVKPMIEGQKLVSSRPYFTRLYSTMSADEMTVDPAFDFNPDLADVSNVHQAEQVIECSSDVNFCDAPWRIELPQGGVIKGAGCQYNWPLGLDSGLPANLLVVSLSTSGSGDVVENNTDTVKAALFEQSGGMESTGMAKPKPPAAGMPIGGEASPMAASPEATSTGKSSTMEPAASSGSSSGCSVGAVGTERGTWLGLLVAAAASVVARRRRTC